MQNEESSDENSELFKEEDDEAMYKNPYEIRLCDLINVSLGKKVILISRHASIFPRNGSPALPLSPQPHPALLRWKDAGG